MSIAFKVRQVVRKLGLRTPLLLLTSFRYRRERAIASDLLKRIQDSGFEKVARFYGTDDGVPNGPHKYLHLKSHVPDVVREANGLGVLDETSLRVLDIGCGSGCFLFALRQFVHSVRGLDLDTEPIYNDMCHLLQIPRITHRIERFEPLPDLGAPFDVITAFSVCFDCHAADLVWGRDEWVFFLEDCRKWLRPGGRLFFSFNPAPSMISPSFPMRSPNSCGACRKRLSLRTKRSFCCGRPSEFARRRPRFHRQRR